MRSPGSPSISMPDRYYHMLSLSNRHACTRWMSCKGSQTSFSKHPENPNQTVQKCKKIPLISLWGIVGPASSIPCSWDSTSKCIHLNSTIMRAQSSYMHIDVRLKWRLEKWSLRCKNATWQLFSGGYCIRCSTMDSVIWSKGGSGTIHTDLGSWRASTEKWQKPYLASAVFRVSFERRSTSGNVREQNDS